MDNIAFVDEENIPMIHQDEEDYDNYGTPNASWIDETLFTVPDDPTKPTSMLKLRQKVKQDKLIALYRHLGVTGNPDLIDLDRFRLTKDPKKGSQFLSFTTATIDGSP